MKQPKPAQAIWYIEEPLEKWLCIYPEFRLRNRTCITCKKVLEYKQPYICGDYAGIITEPCVCGANPLHVLARRKRKKK
jgi:hypothetical protein